MLFNFNVTIFFTFELIFYGISYRIVKECSKWFQHEPAGYIPKYSVGENTIDYAIGHAV